MKVIGFLFYLLCGVILVNGLIVVVLGTIWLINTMIDDWFDFDIVQTLIKKWRRQDV